MEPDNTMFLIDIFMVAGLLLYVIGNITSMMG